MGDVMTSQWGHVFVFLAKFTWPWAPTQQANFWIKFFVETKLSSASLKPLIDLLAYLEPELWLKNNISYKYKNCRKSVICPLTANVASHISAADYATELLKPSKDSWSLVV